MTESGRSLSEGQKACLRLVAQGMSSKEIAKALGLAPQTVDTYVKTSMARLGVSSRREAARIVASEGISQKSGSPPAGLAGLDGRPDQTATTGAGWLSWVRPPPVGGGFHDLSWSQKTYQALLVAVISTAVVIALALAIAGLFQTFS